MATDDNTYGTVERVEARVGDLVSGRKFLNTTVPTVTEVESLLDDVAARINGELRINGYTVPVATGDDPEAFAWLRAANSAGAAAMVLNSVPGESMEPDATSPEVTRIRGLWAELNAVLKAIKDGSFPATRSVTSKVMKAYAGSQEDEDGKETKPAFTRERTSYPGVW